MPEPSQQKPVHVLTLGGYIRKVWRARKPYRPASLYLLIGVPIAMIAAAPAFYTRQNPHIFALHLTLLLILMLVMVIRALRDIVEIARRHRTEDQALWTHAFGNVHKAQAHQDKHK